jgi:hypothetical protein
MSFKFLACGLSLLLAAGTLAQTPPPQRPPEPDEEIFARF